MIFRSKAPLRIGLAGGGTDVSPYSDLFGGAVVNATISLYAHASLEPWEKPIIALCAADRGELIEYELAPALPIDGKLDLLKGVYNRVQKDFPFPLQGFRLTSTVDVPAGSGLGTSSTLVTALVGVFREWLQLPLDALQVARLAYAIERKDLKWAGGKQDQYAAALGGFNYMEFNRNDEVKITPLTIPAVVLSELENNLLLYYTHTSRNSAAIIEEQVKNVQTNNCKSIEAMHFLKKQAENMRALLQANAIDSFGALLDQGFEYKRAMAAPISNAAIEAIYHAAKAAGATGGKISGAGGGGFLIFYCPENKKGQLIKALERFGGEIQPYHFVGEGMRSWGEGLTV